MRLNVSCDGMPCGHGQEPLEETLLGLAERRHVHTALRPAPHGAQGDHQDLQQQMPGRIPRPRVLKVGKALRKSTHGVISTLNTQHPACRIQNRITRKSLDPGQPGPESSNAIPLMGDRYRLVKQRKNRYNKRKTSSAEAERKLIFRDGKVGI